MPALPPLHCTDEKLRPGEHPESVPPSRRIRVPLRFKDESLGRNQVQSPHFAQGEDSQNSLGLDCDPDLGCRVERALDAAKIQVDPHTGRLTANPQGWQPALSRPPPKVDEVSSVCDPIPPDEWNRREERVGERPCAQ